jgi:TRAP-type C4-dicarboxylate transport system permease small subunit
MIKIVNYYVSLIIFLSKVFGFASTALLMSASLVVCQMVVIRYGFNSSTVWQTEFVKYAIIAATLLGSPYVLMQKGHVSVDLIFHYVSDRKGFWISLLASIIGLACCACLAWASWIYFLEAFHAGWVTATVWGPPLWIPLLPLPLGLSLLTLQYSVMILTEHGSFNIEGEAIGAP